jgi:hypothetical protein
MPEPRPPDLTHHEPVRDARPGRDRWQKVGIALVIVLIVMELILVFLYAREGFDLTWLWPNL